MSEAVRYHTKNTVGIITLDRPDNRNSMTPELLDAFVVASARARADTHIRVLVVTGTGNCFSSGADFKSNWSGLSVDDLFERIKVSMPGDNAGSLSRQQTADILAFVFSISRFPAGTSELVREAEILKSIKFEAFKPDSK